MLPTAAPGVSADDLKAWTAFGGTTEQVRPAVKRGAKVQEPSTIFIAPSGQRLSSWQEAKQVLEAPKADDKPADMEVDTADAAATLKRVKEADDSSKQSTKKKPRTSKTPASKAAPDASAKPDVAPAPEEPAPAADAAKPAKAKKARGKRAADPPSVDATDADQPKPKSEDESAQEGGDDDHEQVASKTGSAAHQRRATSNVKSYKEASLSIKVMDSEMIEVKEEPVVDTEALALEQTGGLHVNKRRLTDFSIVDDEGQPVPLERAVLLPSPPGASLTGVVQPSDGDITKTTGRRVASAWGPVQGWRASWSKAAYSIIVWTGSASYELVKPSSAHRKIHTLMDEQMEIFHQVYLSLCPEAGGNMTCSLEEVVARLARAKVGRAYGGARDALLVNQRFILSQLAGLSSQDPKGKGADYRATPFATALEKEASKVQIGQAATNGTAIRINDAPADEPQADAGPVDALTAADAELAARLQAKLDAQEYAAAVNGGGRGRGQKVAPYIRISEQEIADDYPLPTQYIKEVDEVDELVMTDPDDLYGVDPESLPRHVLHDFAFYNSEGFLSTLELVPMFMGVDHDVDIFGSGVVAEDTGDFTLGAISTTAPVQPPADDKVEGAAEGEGEKPTTAGSGSSGGSAGAAGTTAPEGAMRVFLSQIREWCVECAADMLSISIRTDVAWYRLVNSTAQYAPWYRTVVKAAQLALALLNYLSSEARASRLSFADCVRRLADMSETAPGFVSKKVDRVERFVVVHGQIILNQFKHYPNKAVQRAAFVSELKTRMEQRKHLKLYMTTKKAKLAQTKVRAANPMRNRAATGLKAKPMPATATTMVKAVWHSYFFGGMAARAAEAEAAAQAKADLAKEVAEPELEEEEEEENQGVENALAEGVPDKKKNKKKSGKAEGSTKQDEKKKKTETKVEKVEWEGAALRKDSAGRTLYSAAKLGSLHIKLGDTVEMVVDEDEDEQEAKAVDMAGVVGSSGPLGLVACLYKDSKGKCMVQVCVLLRGCETVLGDVAGDSELFVTEDTSEYPLEEVVGLVQAKHMDRPWDRKLRLEHLKQDMELRSRNEAHLAAGEPLEYFYRTLYRPEQGMFCSIPAHMLSKEGDFIEDPAEPIALGLLPDGAGFILKGVEYKIGDVMYLHPETFGDEPVKKQSVKNAVASKKKSTKTRKGKKSDDKSEADSSSSEDEDKQSEEEVAEEDKAKPADKKAAVKKGTQKKAKRPARGKKAKVDDEDAEMEDVEEVKEQADKEEAPEADKKEDEEPEVPDYLHKGRHKGSNAGLKPFCLGQLVAVHSSKGKEPRQLLVRRLYRPEEISKDLAYESGWWDVYAGPVLRGDDAPASLLVDIDRVVSKAGARLPSAKGKLGDIGTVLDTFCVVGSYDPEKPGVTSTPPTDLNVVPAKSGSKVKAPVITSTVPRDPDEDDEDDEDEGEGHPKNSAVAMKSLDIFAGCGGLSEGMHQAGVAVSKWAIEYEPVAAEAFQLNNPEAKVFANNCNVLLQAAMRKAGMAEDCDACDDCTEACGKLTPEYVAALPEPGEVEFIMGGPPCQGYSGMNRFNKGNWSMVQNSMVMAYLSYADFYRPRYFLLENVRNFVSHNKSFTFRLTVRSLVEMGYQVRFGVLNAGNYGVPQSRKRTIIWAAAPDEALPSWPRPRHVFHSPQLTINLPGGVAYTAVPSMPGGGAPLRAVTVRDAITDLPAIQNGHDKVEAQYTEPPRSAFQKYVRNGATVLVDHICKEMNDLNLERCRCIPKGKPGADWRELQAIVAKHPERELFNGQPLVPWCLPNTADRHNGWRGLFGRLDPNGHFPTSTTDPQPMGKVGQVFHPNQDRIVSVRECARSQGFPDTFKFAGNVHNKHRQVGNAVPPPLAFALGSQLRGLLEARRKAAVQAALEEQLR